MIFLDMDGVLVDFTGAVMRLHGRTYEPRDWPRGVWNIHDVLDVPESTMWERIDALGAYFWSQLDSFPWTLDLIHLVESQSFRIATKPSASVHSYHGKALWLERYGLKQAAILAGDKSLLAQPGRLLVDDSTANCEAWQAAGGTAILFPQPWNHSELTVPEVFDAVREWIDRR